jgi:hypothetical protein
MVKGRPVTRRLSPIRWMGLGSLAAAALLAALLPMPRVAAQEAGQAPETAAPETAAPEADSPAAQPDQSPDNQQKPGPALLAVQPPLDPTTAPAEPEMPKWPANQQPGQATVTWDSHGLSVEATNSSLQQILKDISTATGATVEGMNGDERVFGAYGPGQARDVLSQLLLGAGYNVIMIGDQGKGAPRQILLTARHAADDQAAPSKNANNNDDDQADNDNDDQPAPQQPPIRPGFPGGPPRTPQQMMQERQERLQQLQQQRQNQPQNPNQVPSPNPNPN